MNHSPFFPVLDMVFLGLWLLAVVLGIGVMLRNNLWQALRKQRQQFLNNYEFSHELKDKLNKRYPDFGETEINLVFAALKDYFYFCYQARQKMVSMPSQIVDDAWHEFILFTREYQEFCEKAFGKFLHHTPAEAMTSPTLAQSGIRLAWQLACQKEQINPQKPTKLPLIFEIDKRLNVENGFYYELNCLEFAQEPIQEKRNRYCVTHISYITGCGGGTTTDTVINDHNCDVSHSADEGIIGGGSCSGGSCGGSCSGGSCGGSCSGGSCGGGGCGGSS